MESVSQEPPTTHAASSTAVTYGPYPAVPPFAFSPMRLHFENNAPFVHATLTVQYQVRESGLYGFGPPPHRKLKRRYPFVQSAKLIEHRSDGV